MSEENIVTILDLLNLSLGTPEIGAVNFNLLHRFLLELVKHFSLARKQIDIADDISIQSALEETRMLYGTKSQTHFFGHSSLSEQADGKRELRSRDSSAFHSEKRASEMKSRDNASALEKSDTAASGTQGKDGVNEMVRPGDSGAGQGRGQVVGSVQTKDSASESSAERGIESKESKDSRQGKGTEASGDIQAIQNTGKMTI